MTEFEFSAADKAIRNYKVAWSDTLAAIALTLLNLLTLFAGVYFLFSIYASTLCFSMGIIMKDPELSSMVFSDMDMEISAEMVNTLFGVYLFFGLLIVAVYVVFFFLSRKYNWAMITLLVLFSVDTFILLLSLISALNYSMFIDLALHVALLVFLAKGVKAGSYLKKHFPQQGVALKKSELIALYEAERKNENATRPFEPQPADTQNGVSDPTAFAQPAQGESAPRPAVVDDVFPELNAQANPPAPEESAASDAETADCEPFADRSAEANGDPSVPSEEKTE